MASIAQKINAFGSSTVQFTNITFMVVFENGAGNFKTFAIRFDDAASVQTLLDILNDPEDRIVFDEDLYYLYESDKNPQTYQNETTIGKQQRHLYNFLAANNLNMTLYEANLDNSGQVNNWEKISKDNLDKEPCN